MEIKEFKDSLIDLRAIIEEMEKKKQWWRIWNKENRINSLKRSKEK